MIINWKRVFNIKPTIEMIKRRTLYILASIVMIVGLTDASIILDGQVSHKIKAISGIISYFVIIGMTIAFSISVDVVVNVFKEVVNRKDR